MNQIPDKSFITEGDSKDIMGLGLSVIVLVISILAASVVYMFFPEFRPSLIEEDQLIENLTVIFYFISFVFGLVSLPKLKGKSGFKLLIIVSALGLVGFLDELSFGERILNFSMPRIGYVKIDAIHDFFKLGYKAIRRVADIAGPLIYLLAAGIGVLLIAVLFRYRAKLPKIASEVHKYPPYQLMLFFGFLAVGALLIDLTEDLNIFRGEFLSMFEELFEMNASLTLVFTCFSIVRKEDLRRTNKLFT